MTLKDLETESRIQEDIRAVRTALIEKVKEIGEIAGIDPISIKRRIAAAERNGNEVYGLVNLIVSIAQWPAEQGTDYDTVLMNIDKLKSKGIDYSILNQIKDARGFHSFVVVDEEGVRIVEGTPPKKEYPRLVALFVYSICKDAITEDVLKRVFTDIDYDKWSIVEERAKEKALKDKEEIELELKAHNASM